MPSFVLYEGNGSWFLTLSTLQSPGHLKRFFFFFKNFAFKIFLNFKKFLLPVSHFQRLGCIDLRCSLSFGGLKKKKKSPGDFNMQTSLGSSDPKGTLGTTKEYVTKSLSLSH